MSKQTKAPFFKSQAQKNKMHELMKKGAISKKDFELYTKNSIGMPLPVRLHPKGSK